MRTVTALAAALPLVAALVAGCSTPAATPAAPSTEKAKTSSGTSMMQAANPATRVAGDKLGFRSTTLDGAPFAGESLRGKPSVLWFWAPWCTVCKREAPSVAKAAADNPGVTFVGVSARDELPAMKKFVADHKLGGFSHLNDADAAVWARFGVTYQPSYAFIGKDGKVDVVTERMSPSKLSTKLAELSRS